MSQHVGVGPIPKVDRFPIPGTFAYDLAVQIQDQIRNLRFFQDSGQAAAVQAVPDDNDMIRDVQVGSQGLGLVGHRPARKPVSEALDRLGPPSELRRPLDQEGGHHHGEDRHCQEHLIRLFRQ